MTIPASPWYASRFGARPADLPPRRIGPSASEYLAAVQRRAFVDPLLAEATPQSGLLGLPRSATGQQAVVFPVDGPSGRVAVRFFTTTPDVRRERYRLLAEHLAADPCQALCDFVWVDEAITVGEETWPALVMPWVEGQPLHRAVEERLGTPDQLTSLAEAVLDAHRELRAGRLAHGDLQHGNVLVTAEGKVRLVDLDGVWSPALASHRPGEFGHPNYQHPARLALGTWGERVDTFSALVISATLRALADDPGLWRHHDGENLVLRAGDYREPGTTPAWRDLDRIGGVGGQQLAVIRMLCERPAVPDIELATLLAPASQDAAPLPPTASSADSDAGSAAWWSTLGSARPPAIGPGRAGSAAAQLSSASSRTTEPVTSPPASATAPTVARLALAVRLRRGDLSTAEAVLGGSVGAALVLLLAALVWLTR